MVNATALRSHSPLFGLFQQFLRRVLPVSLRIVLRPPPQVHARLLNALLRLPTQFLVRPARVRRQVQHVSRPAADDLVLQILTAGGAEGFDHVEDGRAFASAEIPRPDARVVLAQVGKGGQVASGQVEDVNVVTDRGAIGRAVV